MNGRRDHSRRRNYTLFPLLKELDLTDLPKLWHFFLTECTFEFSFLKKVKIDDCPEMNMGVINLHLSEKWKFKSTLCQKEMPRLRQIGKIHFFPEGK
ncbi:hypothetical protein H5410_003343 [Solanum commersonii]|uniref:Disease resistance protein n=1 Tax=Solanum commersonii TaxID=4109 RepID=A0A9J6B4U9_SOLCO|nr:hypothetical protein H5410_003343 [Solanum commersonii]